MDLDMTYLGECPWVLKKVFFFVFVARYGVLFTTVRFYCYTKSIMPCMVLYQPQTPSQECFFPPCPSNHFVAEDANSDLGQNPSGRMQAHSYTQPPLKLNNYG